MINIQAILVADGMGLTILFVVAVANIWRLKESSKDNRCLLIMLFCCFINCIMDSICFIVDGKAGSVFRVLAMECNSLLFLGGLLTAIAWVFLIACHLQTELSRAHRAVLFSLFGILFLMVIVNRFVPVLFYVDENNVYERSVGYWVYIGSYLFYMLDGLVLYLRHRHTSGGLKFFPVWAFLIPTTIGMICQSLVYGISTTIPFTTVSIACMIICLQNEFMLRDRLTGLYNRFYINTVEKRLKRYPNLRQSAIFLDINGFKSINDTYGHNAGDQALINLSSILLKSVGQIGEAVRYAGDEFIVLINSQDEACIDGIISEIQKQLDEFNSKSEAPYQLSVAVGSCKLDLSESTMDACIDKVDRLMYKNKQTYYQFHPRNNSDEGSAEPKD